MTFIPENALETALVAANNDSAAQPDFYRLLLASEVLLLGKTDPPITSAGFQVTGPGTKLLLGEVSWKGEQYHPVFSAQSRLMAFRPQAEASFWMIGRDLFTHTPGARFLLNPGSELMWTLSGGGILQQYGDEKRS